MTQLATDGQFVHFKQKEADQLVNFQLVNSTKRPHQYSHISFDFFPLLTLLAPALKQIIWVIKNTDPHQLILSSQHHCACHVSL